MRSLPLYPQPNSLVPHDVIEVSVHNPRPRSLKSYTPKINVPVATFIYEEKDKLKAWSGVSSDMLWRKCLLVPKLMAGEDSAVYVGYLSPLAMLKVVLYRVDGDYLRNGSIESIDDLKRTIFELADATVKLERQLSKMLIGKTSKEPERVKVYEPEREQVDIGDLVYPNRNGYVGD